MASLTEENYLKALFHLSNDKGEVNVNELSKSLNIKMPTVTSMMKKLSEKKLVYYESYKPLRLTERGKKEAGLIIRKHRLTEMFLVNIMGFGWEQVHDVAEQIEHLQSAPFFDKMDEMLGHPAVDPHGSPIPNREGKMMIKSYEKLSDCASGQTVLLTAVVSSDSEFLKFLNSRQLSLGTRIKIKSIEPFDNSMVVSYNKRNETFSALVCSKLLVEAS
jgi:DtxR family Mn-dependent transcriptional regulator